MKLPDLQRRQHLVDEICDEIAQQLLDDFIRGEFLPDLFLDIIGDDTDRFAPYDEQLVICKEIVDEVAGDVIVDLLRSIIRSVLAAMVESYLAQCSVERHRDLVQSMVHSVIDEECRLVLPGLVREVAKHMVDDYLQLTERLAYTEAIMNPFVDEIVTDFCEQIYVDQWAANLIQDLSQEMVRDVFHEFLQGAHQAADRDRVRGELDIVHDHSTIILNQSILQILLFKLATNDENATVRAHLTRILDRVVLERCLTIHYALHEQIRQVKENVALWSLHDTTVSQISADAVLAVLRDQLQAEIDLD